MTIKRHEAQFLPCPVCGQSCRAEVALKHKEAASLPQCPALPDRERMAEILYTAAHEGLRNCWKWSDAGLDHEHPTSRGYWYKVADGALAALSVTRPDRNSKSDAPGVSAPAQQPPE
jgi:hypothetical protein